MGLGVWGCTEPKPQDREHVADIMKASKSKRTAIIQGDPDFHLLAMRQSL